MELHLAEQHEVSHRLVAGSMFLRFGKTLWYAFTGVGDKDLGLHANDLLLWHAIHDAHAAGLRWVDFGEVAEEHPELVRFKTKWGARPLAQYRYYSGSIPCQAGSPKLTAYAEKLCRKLWSRLPLRLTARAGEFVYRRL
jgi:lipid II:glycine glycyltransferase (peptidoglycan interpeptide bridge formation enzyme)